MNINKLDMPLYQVNKLVNNTLHKNNLILPVPISGDSIKELTSKNKVHTISVL